MVHCSVFRTDSNDSLGDHEGSSGSRLAFYFIKKNVVGSYQGVSHLIRCVSSELSYAVYLHVSYCGSQARELEKFGQWQSHGLEGRRDVNANPKLCVFSLVAKRKCVSSQAFVFPSQTWG